MRRAAIFVIALILLAFVLWADATMPLLSCANWTYGCNECGRKYPWSRTYCTAIACPPHKPEYFCVRRFFQSEAVYPRR